MTVEPSLTGNGPRKHYSPNKSNRLAIRHSLLFFGSAESSPPATEFGVYEEEAF